jgi:hypothetical protein
MTRLVRFKDEFSFLLFRLVFHYFPFPLSSSLSSLFQEISFRRSFIITVIIGPSRYPGSPGVLSAGSFPVTSLRVGHFQVLPKSRNARRKGSNLSSFPGSTPSVTRKIQKSVQK